VTKRRRWSLPLRAEWAYQNSVTRRRRASRQDYEAGFTEGWQQALEAMQRTAIDLQKGGSDAVPDVRLDDSAA